MKNEVLESILIELELRKNELQKPIESIYLGGGTPSLLSAYEINKILDIISANYQLSDSLEITLEANPDDLKLKKIKEFKHTPINRFSLGVQSFFDEDLRFMNRSHNAKQAEESIQDLQENGFINLSMDLIYGSQSTTQKMWEENLIKTLNFNIPHVSAYALTVEPNTALSHQIKTKKTTPINEENQRIQFDLLVSELTKNNFVHYEISNFGKPGFFSQHNTSYWLGKPYLGIGPSAHSFDGQNRSWNIANNIKYVKSIQQNELPLTKETLNKNDQFNELIMIGLRTVWGVDLEKIKAEFPAEFYHKLMQDCNDYFENNQIKIEDNHLKLDSNARFLADGIASDLFRI